ncbi:MAG: LacI family DNA-binding transcriptional regulator [Lachnospiraceae bacterium]|nr:LacI family DNA-binding transcriptional regulator [Lachnospiraceae bacterium]
MAATIKDIRKKTGLSLATISKYLNGGNVLPENRQKIDAAVKELHYEVNEIARGLVTSRTKTIGVVVYLVESLFTGALIRHIGVALRREGYGLLICDSNQDENLEAENISFLLGKKVDGMIIIPVGGRCRAQKTLKSAGIPVVILDRPLEGGFDCVRINNREAGESATRLLLENNHRRIGIISSDDRTYTGWERYLGYRDAMSRAGCPVPEEYCFCGEHSIEYGHRSMEALLSMEVPPTAVFATNYEVTLGAVMALNESGKRCPEDISIVGFDNLLLSHVVRPQLYLVVQPMQQMGEEAARLILQRVRAKEDTAPMDVVFGTTLQAGNSIRRLV